MISTLLVVRPNKPLKSQQMRPPSERTRNARLSQAQFGAVPLGRAHHCEGEFKWVNNRRCFRRAKSIGDKYALGKPIEFGRRVTTSVTLGDDKPAISGHALVGPITGDLMGQGGMKLEAPPRQSVKRCPSAPVERKKAASLPRGRRGHFGPLHHDDIGPAASKEGGGACSDHAAHKSRPA